MKTPTIVGLLAVLLALPAPGRAADHAAIKDDAIGQAGAMTAGRASEAPPGVDSFPAIYQIEGDAVVRHNGERTENRPLYGPNMPALALAGDRPFLRLVFNPNDCGALMIGLVRDGQGRWFQQCDDITMRYRPNRIEWTIQDGALAGIEATLAAVSLADAPGLTARLTLNGTRPGDRLVWAWGGALKRERINSPTLLWELDPVGHAERTTRGFVPEDCKENRFEIQGDLFTLVAPALADAGQPRRAVLGRCSAGGAMTVADGAVWQDPAALAASTGKDLPLLCGVAELKGDEPAIYWAMEAGEPGTLDPQTRLADLARTFQAGWARAERIGKQIEVDTPDPWLNIGVANGCVALEAAWYPPTYVHGAMLWNIPFPGWRTIYGPTAIGKHENVKAEARYYVASQVKESTRTLAQADPAFGLTAAAPDSRFYGVGRIARHQNFYNFQSVFFDMLVHAWRWTGDKELEALLRPALELHLKWSEDCFDPDGDGVYESYINTWATDSVWYNGGDTTQETAYAYRGHLALADMARDAGDAASEQRFRARAEKIRVNMDRSLWMTDKGYPAEYRDKLGLQRLHPDTSLYTVFMPIDGGMWTPERAVQALYYTEWGLEREPLYGGESCWTSNWVPSVWSVRERYQGENFHLALAYFQQGLAEEGWNLLKANHREPMFDKVVPGGLGYASAGTDFNDVSSMFLRTVVEGLFGYHPDRPNGVVRLAPAFPAAWDHASIKTPDFTLTFKREGDRAIYQYALTHPARVVLRAPVRAGKLTGVKLNGQDAPYRVEPGFGQSVVVVEVPEGSRGEIGVTWEGALDASPAISLAGNVGEPVTLRAPGGPIIAFSDPTGLLQDARLEGGTVTATLARNPGHKLVFAQVRAGELEQTLLFKFEVNDPQAEAAAAAQELRAVPAGTQWTTVDIGAALNADVRTIYQQHYLTPRVQTTSVQIGEDGYSPWTFYHWKYPPPAIDLTNVDNLLEEGRLMTPQGVPFAWPAEGQDAGKKNIAFTSRWDNWPVSVTVPVGRQGQGVWLLVAGSTNPMQTRLANGVIHLEYADGVTDKLELVPPLNYWTLCKLHASDYDYERDRFALPAVPPLTVQLGGNCRAMLLGRRLREGVELKSVTLEALSNEVVIG